MSDDSAELTTQAMARIGQDLITRVEQLQQQGFQMLSMEERSDLLRMVAQQRRWTEVANHPAMQRLFLHAESVTYSKRSVFENLVIDQSILMTSSAANFQDEFFKIKDAVKGYAQNDLGMYVVEHFGFYELDVNDDEEMAKFYNSQYGELNKRMFLTLLVTTMVADKNWKKSVVKMLFCMYQSGLFSFFKNTKNRDILFSPQSSVFWHKFASAYTSQTIIDTVSDFSFIENLYDASTQYLVQMVAYPIFKWVGSNVKFVNNITQTLTQTVLSVANNYLYNSFDQLIMAFNIGFSFVNDVLSSFRNKIRPKLIERGTKKELVDAIDNFIQSIEALLNSLRINVFGIYYNNDELTRSQQISKETRYQRMAVFFLKVKTILVHFCVGGFYDALKSWFGSLWLFQYLFPNLGSSAEEIEENNAVSVEGMLPEQEKQNCVKNGLGEYQNGVFKLNKQGKNAYGFQENVDIDKLSDSEKQMYVSKGMLEKKDDKYSPTASALNVLTFGVAGVLNNNKKYQNMTPKQLGGEFLKEFMITFPELRFDLYLNVSRALSSLVHIFIMYLPEKWKAPRMLFLYGLAIMFANNVIYSYRRYVSLPFGKFLSKGEVERRREELETPVSRAEAEQLVKDAARKEHKREEMKHEATRGIWDMTKGALGMAFYWLPGVDPTHPDSLLNGNYYNQTVEDFETPMKEYIVNVTKEDKFTPEQQAELDKFAVSLFQGTDTTNEEGWNSEFARGAFRKMKYEAEGTYVDVNEVPDENVYFKGAQKLLTDLNFPVQLAVHLFLAASMGGLHACCSDLSDSTDKKFKANLRCKGYNYTLFSFEPGTSMIDLGCSTLIDSTDFLGRTNNKRVPHYICENCATVVRKLHAGQLEKSPSWNVNIELMQPSPYFYASSVAIGCKQCKEFSKAQERSQDWIDKTLAGDDRAKFATLNYQWRIIVNMQSLQQNPKTGMTLIDKKEWVPSLFGLIALDPPAAFIPYTLMPRQVSYANPFEFLQLWCRLLHEEFGAFFAQPVTKDAYKEWDRRNYLLVTFIIDMFTKNQHPLALQEMKTAVQIKYNEIVRAMNFNKTKRDFKKLLQVLLKKPYGRAAILNSIETKKTV